LLKAQMLQWTVFMRYFIRGVKLGILIAQPHSNIN